MFPAISMNGMKSKWRIEREKEEERIKQNIKDRNKYYTNKPKKCTEKERKKEKVMTAMEGPYYLGDIEVKRYKKKLNEYRYPQKPRYKETVPLTKQELTERLKVRKVNFIGADISKQEGKIWKQYKEQFNEEKNKIMADMYLSREAKKSKKDEEKEYLDEK